MMDDALPACLPALIGVNLKGSARRMARNDVRHGFFWVAGEGYPKTQARSPVWVAWL
jgi:hypothetical protein